MENHLKFENWLILRGNPDKSIAENMMDYDIYCESWERKYNEKIKEKFGTKILKDRYGR